MATYSPRILSLCSGIGGLELGLKLAEPRSRTVCYVELETYAASVLVARMEEKILDEAPIWDSVFTFDGRPWRGKVDCITGGFPCFAAGTLVLTESGYRPIEELCVGDCVLTHLGRWKPITSIMCRENAQLMRVRAQGSDVITTHEHPFYARDVSKIWDNTTRKYRKIYSKPGFVSAESLCGKMVCQVVPEAIIDDNHSVEFWWVVGRYIADGYLCDRKGLRKTRKPMGRTIITCGHKEADDLASRIAFAGFHAYREEGRTATKFHITDTSLYKFLLPFGRLAHGKRIPRCALELPWRKANALLQGYLSGDGYDSYKLRESSSTSRALSMGMSLIAQSVRGVVCSVIKSHRKSDTCIIEGRTVRQRDAWKLNIRSRNREPFIDGIYGWKPVRYMEQCGFGTVWNISVLEDESYIAEGMAVHNCTPHSVAGKRRGKEDDRNLWPQFARIVGEVSPTVCFFENVPNLLNTMFRDVCEDLWGMDYRIEAGIFSAAEVGAPHLRKRLFIMANRESDRWNKRGSESARNEGRSDTSICGCTMADASKQGSQGRCGLEEKNEGWEAETRIGQDATRCGRILADSIGSSVRIEPRRFGGEGWSDSPFPPTPGDAEGWARMSDDAKPAIRGNANGSAPTLDMRMSAFRNWQSTCKTGKGTGKITTSLPHMCSRSDRLRTLGNAVVPLTAAMAWQTLGRKIGLLPKEEEK